MLAMSLSVKLPANPAGQSSIEAHAMIQKPKPNDFAVDFVDCIEDWYLPRNSLKMKVQIAAKKVNFISHDKLEELSFI